MALEIRGALREVLLGSRFPHRGQNERVDDLPDEIGIDGLSAYDAQLPKARITSAGSDPSGSGSSFLFLRKVLSATRTSARAPRQSTGHERADQLLLDMW